ncbi:MAG TPA: VOC family protein [Allosphingosinicella sp.]|nr:VOC family protein [Allosphingosinicella sp.]
MSTIVQSPFQSAAGVRPRYGSGRAPALKDFSHLSLPCRDMEEAIAFYGTVMGGELVLDTPLFSIFRICGVDIGVGSVGVSFMEGGAEYPHQAFFCGPDELIEWRDWLAGFGVPTSPIWTRVGIEALMFFRDPSGNVWELFCEEGFEGADALPRGPARGHGAAVDIDALRYDSWKRPAR